MFTGIVEETGQVASISPQADSIRCVVAAVKTGGGLKKGSSLAINGCCLTVVNIARSKKTTLLTFDVLRETWKRTNLQFAGNGTLVNLERPLKAGDALGGHFVTGHVDGLGKINAWEKRGKDFYLEVKAAKGLLAQIIPKGSISIDGISLTVARVGKDRFSAWIIPHTRAITNLRQRQAGDAVNLETDMLGKYVQRALNVRSKA